MRARRLLALLLPTVAPLLALVAAGAPARAQGVSYLPRQQFDPTQDVGLDQRLGERVPLDAVFRDERGAARPLRHWFDDGLPVVLALVYFECPMLCVMELEGLVASLRAVGLDAGKDFHVLVVSIDPGETPALAAARKSQLLDAYQAGGAHTGAAAGWHLLTGEQPAIDALAGAVGFRYAYDEASDEYAHAAGIAVATPGGVLSRYLLGIEFPARDLRLALVEASQGAIGNAVDQLLLLCYHYDPATGRYGFQIFAALRAGGLLTFGLLAVFVVLSLRKERAQRHATA